jgi:hypothetical protein
MKLINNHGGGWSVVLGKTILSKCRFVLYSPFGASIYHNITASTNAPPISVDLFASIMAQPELEH